MNRKISSRMIIVVVLCIILAGAVYIGYNQFINSTEKNTLQIISMDLMHSNVETNFTVTVKIQNTGQNNITDAELNFIFIKDNDIIDTKKQSLHLPTSTEGTYNASFINIPFEIDSTYKAIATIYLDNLLLDTRTITKQF
jgi:hypothetical protein